MNTHPVIINLTEYITVSAEVRKALTEKLTEQRYIRNQLLLTEGQVAAYIYYVHTGLLRFYYYSQGEQVTRQFVQHGEFILPEYLFNKGRERDYLEALDETVLYSLSLADVEAILEDLPESHELLRFLFIRNIRAGKERERLLRTASAGERYQRMMTEARTIIQTCSQEIIASYLNISAKHLGRIRNQEAKRK